MVKYIKAFVLLCFLLNSSKFIYGESIQVKEKSKSLKPNILFIWTDQQNFGLLSCEGNKYVKTPNLDRLAKEGALLSNAFTTYPSCSPSRATVVSGAYAYNHRLYDNINYPRGLEGFKPIDGYKITQQFLYENGYKVAHRGKWHIGKKKDWGKCFTTEPDYSEAYSPLWNKRYKQKIEQAYPWDKNSKAGNGEYVKGKTPMPTLLTPTWQIAFDTGNLPDWAITGKMLVEPEATMEYSMVDDLIDFIKTNSEETWMATLSLSPPHDPWNVPEPYYSEIAVPLMEKMQIKGNGLDQKTSLSGRVGKMVGDQGVREYMAVYHAQVVMMDDFIGRVLDTLDQNGLTENTLVIFTSDHGDMLGAHSNVGKINNNLYNWLYHVPCIVRYPKKIKSGLKIDAPIMNIDYMPTILDFAGIEAPSNIDGQSFRPLLEGKAVDWRDYHILEKTMEVERNSDHSLKNRDSFYFAMGIEDGRYKYIYTKQNGTHRSKKYSGSRFIDLKRDPLEETNLFENSNYQSMILEYHMKLKKVLEESDFKFMDQYSDDPWSVR